jgi:hypothetical protein
VPADACAALLHAVFLLLAHTLYVMQHGATQQVVLR